MSRVSAEDWSHIPARLPQDGFHKVYARDADEKHRAERYQWRAWHLVIPPLRKILHELAHAERPWPLYLHGPQGHGKTAAVLAFCDVAAEARYWSLDKLMSTVLEDPPWSYWLNLAVLDEIGSVRTGKGRDWDYEIVKRFFEWRKDRPTIYLGNLPLDEKESEGSGSIETRYDGKIFSRLSSGTQYKLVDRDRRRW